MTNPSATELLEISEAIGLILIVLEPLDEEERSRIEIEDNYTLIFGGYSHIGSKER